jgi:hypothetical protein
MKALNFGLILKTGTVRSARQSTVQVLTSVKRGGAVMGHHDFGDQQETIRRNCGPDPRN